MSDGGDDGDDGDDGIAEDGVDDGGNDGGGGSSDDASQWNEGEGGAKDGGEGIDNAMGGSRSDNFCLSHITAEGKVATGGAKSPLGGGRGDLMWLGESVY